MGIITSGLSPHSTPCRHMGPSSTPSLMQFCIFFALGDALPSEWQAACKAAVGIDVDPLRQAQFSILLPKITAG